MEIWYNWQIEAFKYVLETTEIFQTVIGILKIWSFYQFVVKWNLENLTVFKNLRKHLLSIITNDLFWYKFYVVRSLICTWYFYTETLVTNLKYANHLISLNRVIQFLMKIILIFLASFFSKRNWFNKKINARNLSRLQFSPVIHENILDN